MASIGRTCPGNHFALRALFLNIACTLAVFDIAEPVDEKLDGKYHEGFFRYVTDSGYSINGLADVRFEDILSRSSVRSSPVQQLD